MNKANLMKIKKIAEEKGITFKWLANQVGISQSAISALIKVNSTSVETLIKIADALKEPVTTFFETDYGTENSNNGIVGGDFMVNSQKEAGLAIDALIQQLKVKDEQIKTLLKTLNK
ncbi:MAG: helix-turn-helix domain-containing protein [Bacteroidaceae bacterium]|nr:helix-turn-helix domain-containing protein [Bacteroidaceae bacterium]